LLAKTRGFKTKQCSLYYKHIICLASIVTLNVWSVHQSL